MSQEEQTKIKYTFQKQNLRIETLENKVSSMIDDEITAIPQEEKTIRFIKVVKRDDTQSQISVGKSLSEGCFVLTCD